jgi:hypothetical protein
MAQSKSKTKLHDQVSTFVFHEALFRGKFPLKGEQSNYETLVLVESTIQINL